MEAIFSSKLYKSSPRKQKILAALSNDLNVELVQQLREYLDEPEETTEPVELHPKEEETYKEEDDFTSSDSEESNTEHTDTFYNNSKDYVPTSSKESSELETSTSESDKEESKPTPKIDREDTSDSTKTKQNDSEKKSENLDLSKFHSPRKSDNTDEESTNVESSSSSSEIIESATALYTDPIEASCHCICDYVDVEAIRGTLNAREDTNGVSRIFIKEKENELWIYYQDKINLNSVMEPVISVLNSTGFTNLEFNRLARTDNAIVFEVSCVFNPVEPIKSDE